MRYVRAFALICFSFGLFVQTAAQASATPHAQTANAMDCSKMARSANAEARMQPEDEGAACEMTLECLIAMNCIPPIALTDPAAADAPSHSTESSYQPNGIARLSGAPLPPESPPPQLALTA